MSGPFPSAWQAGLDGSKADRRAERLAGNRCLICWRECPPWGWHETAKDDEGTQFFCSAKCFEEHSHNSGDNNDDI